MPNQMETSNYSSHCPIRKGMRYLSRMHLNHVLVSCLIKSIIEVLLYHKQIKEARNVTITFAHLLFLNNKQNHTIHTLGCKKDAIFQNIDGLLRSSINMAVTNPCLQQQMTSLKNEMVS